MNKKLVTAASLITLSLVSCVTPAGSTIASLGMGSDSAAVNSGRGRADALMSRAQAENYSRQRRQVSEEMALEQQKRANMLNNTGKILSFFQ